MTNSLLQPVEEAPTVARLQKALAKETNTTVVAVEEVTHWHGKRIFEAAQRAHLKCHPGEEDWLGMALACNAAPNKTARRLIENHARHLWNDWITATQGTRHPQRLTPAHPHSPFGAGPSKNSTTFNRR